MLVDCVQVVAPIASSIVPDVPVSKIDQNSLSYMLFGYCTGKCPIGKALCSFVKMTQYTFVVFL